MRSMRILGAVLLGAAATSAAIWPAPGEAGDKPAPAEPAAVKPGFRTIAINRSACTDKGKKLYKASVKLLKPTDFGASSADLVARETSVSFQADLFVKLVDASKDKTVAPGGGRPSS